jgi:hypothetical protein
MALLVLIGIGAGLASAVLFSSAMTGTALGMFVLFFLAPLPLALAGLGWTWLAAALGASVAAFVVSLLGTGRTAIFHALTVGAPTTLACWLLLLSRGRTAVEAVDGDVEWYPIGRIVALAAAWGAVLAAIAMLSTAGDIESLKAALRQTFERVFANPATMPPGAPRAIDQKQLTGIVELMTIVFAGVTASMWMAVTLFNLWLAGRITRASGRLARPWPVLSDLTLPPAMPLAFAAAIAGSFLPDLSGLIASGYAAAVMSAYVLVGLAILHHVTRGSASRPMILAAVYGALFLLNPFSSFIIALIGLAEPFSPLSRHRGGPGGPPATGPPPST